MTIRRSVYPILPVVLMTLAAASLNGCGESPQQTASFATAESSGGPVTVEGIPDVASIRQETGKPTEFTITEESSARKLQVVAPPDVAVPANLPNANYVVVTGTYDAQQRQFKATRVETRVPTRENQPRG